MNLRYSYSYVVTAHQLGRYVVTPTILQQRPPRNVIDAHTETDNNCFGRFVAESSMQHASGPRTCDSFLEEADRLHELLRKSVDTWQSQAFSGQHTRHLIDSPRQTYPALIPSFLSRKLWAQHVKGKASKSFRLGAGNHC